MSNHIETGKIGEEIAVRFLAKQGFLVIERNYRKKWGEIDVIAKKGEKIYFVEVKSVSRENLSSDVKLESQYDVYQAEDNLHPRKLERLRRVVETYCMEKNIEEDFQMDAIIVKINEKNKIAKIKRIENIC